MPVLLHNRHDQHRLPGPYRDDDEPASQEMKWICKLKAKRNFRESELIPDLCLIFDEKVKFMITFVT